MQVHRFIAVDQQMKASGDVQQYVLDRHAVGQFEEQRGQLRFAFGHHGGGEQRLLVVEVTVNGQLRYTGFSCHRVHAGARVTIAQKKAFSRLEDRLALGEVLRAAGAVGCRKIVGHFSL